MLATTRIFGARVWSGRGCGGRMRDLTPHDEIVVDPEAEWLGHQVLVL